MQVTTEKITEKTGRTMTRPDLVDRGTDRASYLFLLLLLPTAFTVGCGGHSSPPDCGTAVALSVAPVSATADHLAAAPGNKSSFVAADVPPDGCPPTPSPLRLDLKWTVSDTTNATIGNTQNVDYGVATCVNATSGPVTVTAAGTNAKGATITGTAMLTCK
jgi:hypothetical protein